jgi:hypothetical protein
MKNGRGDMSGTTATFILLSYARPQNMQRILNAVLGARSCAKIVLSNNNPEIDILDYVDPSPARLTIVQQAVRWPAVKRFCIARDSGDAYFVCIDDDLFLTVQQIDALVERLAENPSVPHGVWGANVEFGTDTQGRGTVLLQGGLRNMSEPVRILNRVYAFTGGHVRRFFELLASLGIEDPRALGPADDILLSHSGAGLPLCHDLGALEECPTSDQEGIALWKEPGFLEARIAKIVQLRRLLESRVVSTGAENDVQSS